MTALHYNFYRTYDPATGRYLEPDPIGQAGGLNPYVYALASPTNFVDPEGLDTAAIRLSFSAGASYGATFEVGFAADDGGGVAAYWSAGSGVTVGGAATATVGVAHSDATTVDDLKGPFVGGSAKGGVGVCASVDAFYGVDGNGKPVHGYGVSVGVGGGAATSATVTGTKVLRIR